MTKQGKRQYAIVGVGGVGGYFGGRLAQAGHDVKFLLHSDYEHVREHGLTVKSHVGDFALPKVEAYRDVREMGVADVVIVCMKTTRERLLGELLPPLIGDDTIVVLIQNGIGVEADVAEMLPGVRLVAGLAFICSTKTGPGEIWHQFFGNINFAPYNIDAKEVEPIVEDFALANVQTQIMGYEEARWKKALWNIPFNGLSVVLGMQTDGLTRGEAAKICRAIMDEVKEASHALGVADETGKWLIGDEECDKMMAMTQKMPAYSPSMRVDYDNGREMEIEYLYRRPVKMAQEAGVRMWKTEMLTMELEALSQEAFFAGAQGDVVTKITLL